MVCYCNITCMWQWTKDNTLDWLNVRQVESYWPWMNCCSLYRLSAGRHEMYICCCSLTLLSLQINKLGVKIKVGTNCSCSSFSPFCFKLDNRRIQLEGRRVCVSRTHREGFRFTCQTGFDSFLPLILHKHQTSEKMKTPITFISLFKLVKVWFEEFGISVVTHVSV